MLANGMVKPLFESKSDLQIERLLAAQWGLEDLLPKSYEELGRFMLDGAGGDGSAHEGHHLRRAFGQGRRDGPSRHGRGLYVDGTADFSSPLSGDRCFTTTTSPTRGTLFPCTKTPTRLSRGILSRRSTRCISFRARAAIAFMRTSAAEWFQEDFGPNMNIAPEDAEARGMQRATRCACSTIVARSWEQPRESQSAARCAVYGRDNVHALL